MGDILTQQDAGIADVTADTAEPSGLVPIAVPPPPPSPSAQPHLLTPSQLMQAAKAALPRSVSGVSRLSCQPSGPEPTNSCASKYFLDLLCTTVAPSSSDTRCLQ